MAMSDRIHWLFPTAPEGFDPEDGDGRAALIRAEHPDLVEAIDAGDDLVDVGAEPMNPHLHLALHEVVATQLWNDDPPEMWPTVTRLRAAGYERHEILHMLAFVAGEAFRRTQQDQAPFDPAGFAAHLAALPEIWHDLGDDDDRDDDEEFDGLLDAALDLLAEQGPLSIGDLADQLDADADDIAIVGAEPQVTLLADERLASIPALLKGTILTRRLTEEEAAGGLLRAAVDLAPALAFVCGGDHIHLVGGGVADVFREPGAAVSDNAMLTGPPGWLKGAAAGDMVGIRLSGATPMSEPALEVVPVDGEPVVPDILAGRLMASFGSFGDGDGMPVRVEELLYQLAVDAPALVGGVMVPLSTILASAGFEVRGGYTAPAGADWETFGRLQHDASVAVQHGLAVDDAHGLVLVCELFRQFRLGRLDVGDRELAREAAALVQEPDVAGAFADAVAEFPEAARDFLARLRSLAGRRFEAGLAWAESLVAGRSGQLERAESCLRIALAADPEDPVALEDAAWYASDRGDAAQAVRFLDRLEDDGDEERTAMLRRYAASPRVGPVGRNDPCPCGSGRKYKHCCLLVSGGSPARPLPERVRWVWEKLQWWIERAGPEDEVFQAMIALHGPRRVDDDDELGLSIDMDMAASLILFADGAVQDFLHQRGPLLPEDERNLVTQWALNDASLFQVEAVRRGEGVDLRDLRTGDRVAVTERKGSEVLVAGDVLFGHPVFDGRGHQFVGGILPVPLPLRQPLMTLLDDGATGLEVAQLLGRARLPLPLPNREGEQLPPEAAEMMAAMMREHEDRWVDEPVPALAGLTPRQAAADPTRREDLEALLHEFERMTVPAGIFSFDVGRLRQLLGIAPP